MTTICDAINFIYIRWEESKEYKREQSIDSCLLKFKLSFKIKFLSLILDKTRDVNMRFPDFPETTVKTECDYFSCKDYMWVFFPWEFVYFSS